MVLNDIIGDSKCDSLSNVMVKMTFVDDTSSLVPYKIKSGVESR